MKTNISLFIIFCFCFSSIDAQILYEHFTYPPSSTGFQMSEYVDGHFLLTGESIHPTSNLIEAFVTEIDEEGEFVQIRKTFVSSNDRIGGKGVIPQDDGSFLWIVDKAEPQAQCNVEIFKIGEDFSEIWKKEYCYSNADKIILEDVLELEDGFLLWGAVFLPGSLSQCFGAKLNFEGEVIWEKLYPDEGSWGMEVVFDGSFFYGVSNKLNFPETTIHSDIYMIHQNGNLLNTLSYGGMVNGIMADGQGNTVVCGEYSYLSPAEGTGFIGMLNSSFEWEWFKNEMDFGEEPLLFNQVVLSDQDLIICSGIYTTSELPFDDDIFVMSIDYEGNKVAKQFYHLSSEWHEQVHDMKLMINGHLMLTGFMNGALDIAEGQAFLLILNTEQELVNINQPMGPNPKFFDVFPNPAVDYITVKHGELLFHKMELLNINGIVIKTFKFPATRTKSISMRGLKSGIYFLKLYTTVGTSLSKIQIVKTN